MADPFPVDGDQYLRECVHIVTGETPSQEITASVNHKSGIVHWGLIDNLTGKTISTGLVSLSAWKKLVEWTFLYPRRQG